MRGGPEVWKRGLGFQIWASLNMSLLCTFPQASVSASSWQASKWFLAPLYRIAPMPMVWNILGLLALKTKHNEHKKVCISQDSWLKQQRLTRFLKPEASLLQGSWGLTESTGSCNQAWRIGRNACGGRAERGVGSQPADTVHWDRPVLHLCNPSSRMRALVASIMGIWERGLQWEMGFRIRLLSKTYTMKTFFLLTLRRTVSAKKES